MPRTQDNCRQGSPCTDQQPPFLLLPHFEFQEQQPNSQAFYPQLVSSLYGNSLSEFATPSCINPRWLHDLSTTVGTYRSATCHLLHPADQRQTLDFSPDIPEIPAFTFFDPNEIMPSDSRCSGIDKFHISVVPNGLTLVPGLPAATPRSHGENPLNLKHPSSNATRRAFNKRPKMKEPRSTRALKRCRLSSQYSEQDNVKLPCLGNFPSRDMNNHRKAALIDNSPPSPQQTDIIEGQDDKVDTFSQDLPSPDIPKGNAAYALLELSKRNRVVLKEVIGIPYATKDRVPAETISS